MVERPWVLAWDTTVYIHVAVDIVTPLHAYIMYAYADVIYCFGDAVQGRIQELTKEGA